MNIDENQAIEIAKKLLIKDVKQPLPLIGAIYIPAAKAGGAEGFYSDQSAQWLVSFKCETPAGFYPGHIDIIIDPKRGAAFAWQMS